MPLNSDSLRRPCQSCSLSLIHGGGSKMRPGKIGRLVVSLFALALTSLHAFSAGAPPLSASTLADKVLVLKSERKLLLISGDQVLKTYPVSLGGNPIGPKVMKGDSKTPEGKYVLDRHNTRSQYHKSIHISYPNPDDVAR